MSTPKNKLQPTASAGASCAWRVALAVASIFFAGCAASSSPGLINRNRGASMQTAPKTPVDVLVINKIDPPGASSQQPSQVSSVMAMPATYRQVVVDGQTVLVRETDPRKVLTTPGVQVIAGDIANNEIAVQPGLMSQEMAAEIVRTRAQVDELANLLPKILAQLESMNQTTDDVNKVVASALLQLKRVATYTAELQKQVDMLKEQQQGRGQAPAQPAPARTGN